MHIRRARADDAAALLEIYAPLVADTAISFEEEIPSEAEFARRIEAANTRHAWLVGERGGTLCGYAYGAPHASRSAYRYTVDTSVYVHPAERGRHVGRDLYQALLETLADLGFYQAYALITVPNPGSVALHRQAGFHYVGTLPAAGFKFGRWHDVSCWHRMLRSGTPPA